MGRLRPLLLVLILAGGGAYWFSNQQEVPFSGRSQFVTISVEQAAALGEEAYKEVLSQEKVVSSGSDAETIERIGRRLAAVSKPEDPGFDWQFTYVESPQANAFALPGGFTAVYSGLMPIAQNEDGLAAVIGHEMGHAIARHGSERMSQQQVVQVGAVAVGLLLGDQSIELQRIAMQAFGLGAQFGFTLPFSRKHEEEADYIGLILTARACFDPREAPKIWERMSEAGQGQPPEFASTHPAHETRIANLNAWMPEALEVREASCGSE